MHILPYNAARIVNGKPRPIEREGLRPLRRWQSIRLSALERRRNEKGKGRLDAFFLYFACFVCFSLQDLSFCGSCSKRADWRCFANTQELASLPLWMSSAEGDFIIRSFVAKNFASAMAFLNGVAKIAEEQGHHPDLHLTQYRNVEIRLQTHSMRGEEGHCTRFCNDFETVLVAATVPP